MNEIIIIVGVVLFGVYVTYLLKKSKDRVKEHKLTHTVHTNEDTISDKKSGVTLLPGTNRYVTMDQIVQYYKETQECTGLSADGPSVKFASFKQLNISAVWGIYMSASKTVMINTDLKRDALIDKDILKHEFVHHLMSENGLSEESSLHGTDLFTKCGIGVNTSNGVAVGTQD